MEFILETYCCFDYFKTYICIMKVHPKRMNWIVKRLAWVVAALLLLFIVLAAIQYKRKSLVKELRIKIEEDEQGNEFVDEEDVIKVIFDNYGHNVEGQTVEKIDVQGIEIALEKDVFIQKADVYIDALNNVNIKVTQRQPILRVMDVEDESYYLDGEGRKIPTSTKYTARTIVATGDIGIFNESYLELPENRLNQLFYLAKAILKRPFIAMQIEQIHLDHSGDAILVPKLGNHKIFFGNPGEEVDDKLERLQIFYEEGMPYEGWEKYKSISLAFSGQVVAKKRTDNE
jgi:cell division protein FtsQ